MADRSRLDGESSGVKLLSHSCVDTADANALVGAELDQPAPAKLLKCLSDRGLRDPESSREIALHQWMARPQCSLENPLAESLSDLISTG